MTLPTTPAKVVEALRSAGATEEIIAVAVKAGGECGAPHRASEAARKRPKRAARRPPDADLLQALYRAAEGHADPDADIAPIAALLDQGCDLEKDILPIVPREVPELPRPLKNWGAQWRVREILAAREQRLAGHRVEAPPPAQRTPAIDWDEFVGGYRASLIEWNRARLGPKPGEPGCRAPAEVLREHGFRP